MIVRGISTSLAALSLAFSPVVATAAPRSAPVEQPNALGDSNSLFFYVGIAVVIAAIVLLAKDEEDDPISA